MKKKAPCLPKATHSNLSKTNLQGELLLPWNTFWECSADLQSNKGEFISTSKTREERMKFIPPGGHWRHFPPNLLREAMGRAYFSGGGKMGFYRRLSWDEPSPTVVTSPTQKGTMFYHPEANRPLSVEEYKRVQGFPDDWIITGSTNTKYRLIGNAVPVHLSYAIARKVAELLS